MRPKLQKQSVLELAGRIIPLAKLSGTVTINNTPKLALGFTCIARPGAFAPVVMQIAVEPRRQESAAPKSIFGSKSRRILM